MPNSQEPGRPDGPGALQGLLVADFSRVLAGPFATQILADLGADVIKVESPNGDETRGWLPPAREGVSTYYLGINRNKRSLALDFRDEEDRTLAHRLTARADVVIENFKPGTLAKYGLDYPSVAGRNPRVVYASITGYGPHGGAELPGYDLTVQAASGLMSLTGEPEGAAYRSGVSVFDVMTGLHAVIGILAALRHRDREGNGQHVQVNLLSTALAAMANHSSTYVAGGIVPFRMGNAHPSLFPYEPLLETLIVERFVAHATLPQMDRLTVAVFELGEVVDSTTDTGTILAARDRLYAALFAGAASPVLQQLVETIQARVRVLCASSLSEEGRSHAAANELRAVVTAIRDRDAARATLLIREHLQLASAATRRTLPEC